MVTIFHQILKSLLLAMMLWLLLLLIASATVAVPSCQLLMVLILSVTLILMLKLRLQLAAAMASAACRAAPLLLVLCWASSTPEHVCWSYMLSVASVASYCSSWRIGVYTSTDILYSRAETERVFWGASVP
jgi:hypothetical protein